MEQNSIDYRDKVALAIAKASGSFEEYLKNMEKFNCDKAASAAASSDQTSSGPVQGTSDSNGSSDAPAVSVPIVQLKTEPLSHPCPSPESLLPVVEAPIPVGTEAPDFTTKLTVHSHPIVGTYITETQEKVDKAEDWWKTAFFGGRDRSAEMASEEDIISWIHELDFAEARLRATQQGARETLKNRLSSLSSKRRDEIAKHDKEYREAKAPKATKPKVEKEKKSTAGKSKGMIYFDALMTMGFEFDEAVAKIREEAPQLLDDAVEIYAEKTYKGQVK